MINDDWVLLARMPNRTIAGVIPTWKLKATLRYNKVASWQLTVPPEVLPLAEGWPREDAGIILLRNGKVVLSGMNDEDEFRWSAESDNEDESGPGIYTLSGGSDLGWLSRIIYPQPTLGWAGNNDANFRYPFLPTGGKTNAEDVLRTLVNYQAGSLAPAKRQVAGLKLGTAKGIGDLTFTKQHGSRLLPELRRVARRGGGLQFDVLDGLDTFMYFNVEAQRDRTLEARFSSALGTVRNLVIRRVAPTATAVLVEAQKDGTNKRIRREYTTAANYRREVLLDQRSVEQGDDMEDQLAEEAQEVLDEGARQVALSAEVIDSETVQWGRDYDLGDLVLVDTPYGPYTDKVRQVDIEIDNTGLSKVSSIVGNPEFISEDPLLREVRKLSDKIRQLEKVVP